VDVAAPRDEDVLRLAMDQLADLLPEGWVVRGPAGSDGQGRPDAVLVIEGPNEACVEVLLEVKARIVTRDVPFLLERLRGMPSGRTGHGLVARYLSPPTRQRVVAGGGNYLDATGNIRIVSDDPPMVVLGVGATRDPWRGPGRPRGTLRGAPAARVVRTLVDLAPPYSVPELARASGASTGATYRVVELLKEADLLEREERGPIRHVAWRRSLLRWADDYEFGPTEVLGRYASPRGIQAALDRLREYSGPYAVTGSVAAQFYAPYAPPALLAVHAGDPAEVAEFVGLREVESGANVLVAASADGFPSERAARQSGLLVAAPSQVAADLLSLPGRGPAEAEALLDWMEENERAWRR
jgi:hypothetical protein